MSLDLLDSLSSIPDPATHCFLCSNPIGPERTKEHVIPDWAQRRYNLRRETLTLLNQTTIPYAQLTIPACAECNSTHLGPLEHTISRAVEGGRAAVAELDPTQIQLWLGKVLYGLLYRETLLLADRSDPSTGTIVMPETLAELRSHRLFLQQARGLVSLANFAPGSLFLFETQVVDEPHLNWDFIDHIPRLVIGIRVGRVGMIAALADGGAQAMVDEQVYAPYYQLALHPLQFREIFARVAYRSTLATRVPKYLLDTSVAGTVEALQLPIGGLSTKPLFEDWIPADYARFLSEVTGLPYERAFHAPASTHTWLHEHPGSPPLFIDRRILP